MPNRKATSREVILYCSGNYRGNTKRLNVARIMKSQKRSNNLVSLKEMTVGMKITRVLKVTQAVVENKEAKMTRILKKVKDKTVNS